MLWATTLTISLLRQVSPRRKRVWPPLPNASSGIRKFLSWRPARTEPSIAPTRCLSLFRKTSDGLDADLTTITNDITDTTTTLKPALVATAAAATSASNMAQQASKDLADPNIPATLKNINDGTHQIALTAGSVAHTADNLDRKVDKMLHPGFWGAVKAYTVFGAQLATDAIEMHYYLSSVAPGATVQTVKAAVTHIAKPLTHRPAAK